VKNLEKLNIDDDVIIWRYVDFIKFVSILTSSSFFHSRMDLLGDPFEGSVTSIDMNDRLNEWMEKSMDGGVPPGIYKDDEMARVTDPRTEIYVSCWHQSPHENVAMWKIYSDEQKGIAIRTTVGKLRSYLPKEGRVRRVEYLNYEKDKVLNLSPIYCKRQAFSYEKEIRSVIPYRSKEKTQPFGMNISVDLNSFIDEIILSPQMPVWIKELVRDIIKRIGVDVNVNESSIKNEPIFNWYIGGLE